MWKIHVRFVQNVEQYLLVWRYSQVYAHLYRAVLKQSIMYIQKSSRQVLVRKAKVAESTCSSTYTEGSGAHSSRSKTRRFPCTLSLSPACGNHFRTAARLVKTHQVLERARASSSAIGDNKKCGHSSLHTRPGVEVAPCLRSLSSISPIHSRDITQHCTQHPGLWNPTQLIRRGAFSRLLQSLSSPRRRLSRGRRVRSRRQFSAATFCRGSCPRRRFAPRLPGSWCSFRAEFLTRGVDFCRDYLIIRR